MTRNLKKNQRRSPLFVSQTSWHEAVGCLNDITPEHLRLYWLGSDDLLKECFSVALAACFVLAHRETDELHIETVIDASLSKSIKSGCSEAHEVLAGAAAYWKDGKFWSRLKKKVSIGGPEAFLTEIMVWAHMQRSMVAKGALHPDDARVLEGTLALACIPGKDASQQVLKQALEIIHEDPR